MSNPSSSNPDITLSGRQEPAITLGVEEELFLVDPDSRGHL